MKGHAIHDAAEYVPKPLFEYWKKRDPILRMEEFLVKTKRWLTSEQNDKLIADVERELEENREWAVNSPMPTPESAAGGVYCDEECHTIRPKYGVPKARGGKSEGPTRSDAVVHLK